MQRQEKEGEKKKRDPSRGFLARPGSISRKKKKKKMRAT